MDGVAESVRGQVAVAVEWLRLGVETVGAIIIAVGVATALWHIVVPLLRGRSVEFTIVRLGLARHLALALEFQLGADILSTAIAPGWSEIGKLGAIAVIRTGLNYFLMREMSVAGERPSP